MNNITRHEDQRCKTSKQDRQEIYRLHSQGWTYRALAQRFGLSLSRAAAICYEVENQRQNQTERRER